jgi:hypothetical protein
MVSFTLAWAVCSVAYLLFCGQFSTEELAAAALCGLAGALWRLAIRRAAPFQFRFVRGAAGAAFRAAAGLPSATLRVAAKLLETIAKGGEGAITTAPFFGGRQDDPADAGRRAVAVLGVSLAPDSFVIRLPEGENQIHAHALVKNAGGADARWGQ